MRPVTTKKDPVSWIIGSLVKKLDQAASTIVLRIEGSMEVG